MSPPEARNALARLDVLILSLETERQMVDALRSDLSDHFIRIEGLIGQLREIRQAMRPILDPDAPAVIS